MRVNMDFLAPKSKVKLKGAIRNSFFFDTELQIKSYQNACVFVSVKNTYEGGVLDSEGYVIPNSRFIEIETEKNKIQLNSYRYIDRKAIYIGMFMHCFGHAITDDLKKIWFLKTDYCKQLLLDGADIVCLSRYDRKLKPYVYHILELAGVDWKKTKLIEENVCYKEVIIPDNSFLTVKNNFNVRLFSLQFKDTIAEIKRHVKIKNAKSHLKIYLSRCALNDWRECGEEKVEKIFRKSGYTIVYPEKMSFEDQIKLYNECSEIATTEGSISHALMFCKPQTKVVILRKGNFINGYQLMINELANLDVVYIDANKTFNSNVSWDGPFYIYPTKYLCEYLCVKYRNWLLLDLNIYVYMYMYVKKISKGIIRNFLCSVLHIDGNKKSLILYFKNVFDR